MSEWVVPWAAWGWAIIFIAMFGFEFYAVWWNNKRGDGKQRANLTAYVRAYFGVGDRRLKYRARRGIMAGILIWALVHFLGYV